MITSTITASLLGLLGALLPKILDYFVTKQKSADLKTMNDHEKDMYQLATVRLQQGSEQRIRELDEEYRGKSNLAAYSYANPTEGPMASFSASVRPVITYLFTFLFCLKVIVTLFYVIGLDLQGKETTVMSAAGAFFKAMGTVVWDPETRDLYATIIMFWFGDRTFNRKK